MRSSRKVIAKIPSKKELARPVIKKPGISWRLMPLPVSQPAKGTKASDSSRPMSGKTRASGASTSTGRST